MKNTGQFIGIVGGGVRFDGPVFLSLVSRRLNSASHISYLLEIFGMKLVIQVR